MKAWERRTAPQVSGLVPWQVTLPYDCLRSPRCNPPWLPASRNQECQYRPPTLSPAKLVWTVTSFYKTSACSTWKAAGECVSLLKSTHSLERDVEKMKCGMVCNVQIHSGFFKWRALEKKKFHVLWDRWVWYFFSYYLLLYLLSSPTF